MSRTPQKRHEERELGKAFIDQYFPNVTFSDFEIRKIGQMLVPVLNVAKATAKQHVPSECRHCDGTIPFGRCFVCGDDMVLSFQGILDGEHVCSVDCINADCEANE